MGRSFLVLGLGTVLSCSCGSQEVRNPSTKGHPSCLPVEAGATTCWRLVMPLGSGGFPSEPGSQDSPRWEPGRFPLGLQPVIAFNDDLWMLSRTHAWSSSDGLTWAHVAKTDWGERIWHEVVYFDHNLWMYGGLRYADRVVQNDIWSSADGASWTRVGEAAWSPRARHRVIAFGEKLWLFGGADRVTRDFTTEHMVNDVWSSDDGVLWVQRAAEAAFSPREEAKVIAFGDGLLMLGAQGVADVWRSPDGVTWTPLSSDPGYGPRNDFAVAVFAGRLWVYGGWRDTSTHGLNDIWTSADGVRWTRQTEHAPWGPRSPKTVVFKDRLWIYSGKHTGAPDNWGGDLWTMTADDG